MSSESNHGAIFPVRPSLGRDSLWIASVVLVYFVVARLSLSLVFLPEGIAAIWPPAGIFLSAILLTRRPLRPWMAGALFIADFVAEMLAGTPWVVSILYALILTGDAVLSSWLLLRFVGETITFDRIRELVGWLLLSVIFSNGLGSLAAATVASRLLPNTSFWSSWQWWMTSDGIGNLVFTPVILGWAALCRTRLRGWTPERLLEGAVLFVLLTLLNYIAFDRLADYGLFSLLLTYLSFPFLLWAALRFGVRGVASGSAIMTVIAVYFASEGRVAGLLFGGSVLDVVIMVQLYVAVMAIPALFLATVVTERSATEDALRESEARFRVIASNTPDHILMQDRQLRYTFVVNPQLGLTEQDMVGKTDYDILSEEEAGQLTRIKTGVLESGKPTHLETSLISSAGEPEYFDGSLIPRFDSHGLADGLIGYFRNVTERVRAEAALHHAEERYRRLFEGAPVMYIITRNEGGVPVISDCNTQFLSTLGYERGEVLGRLLTDFYTPASRKIALETGGYQRALDGHFAREERELVTRAGALVQTVTEAVPETGPGGGAVGTWAIFTDITARREAEAERERLLAEVQEQARRIKVILDTVPEGVLLIDASGRLLLANPGAERDLAVLTDGQPGEPIYHLAERPLAEFLTSPPQRLWHEVQKDRRTFAVLARPVVNGPEPERYVLVINDISREREVQVELQQQERLAAVGQLAAGIAHDFNNILAVIVLYTQMDLHGPDLSDRLRSHLQTIEQEAKHAADLVQQILDFGRRAVLEPHPLDLVPFLKERAKLLERTLPENIRIAFHHPPDEAIVNADPTRMQQMITNLAVNARDAMPDGGDLRIELEKIRIESHQNAPLHGMTAGVWIRIAVSDTGCGIAPEALPRMFEPFFTTKEPGKGTGLGLAQVYGIVKQHAGYIGVQTQVNRGTIFTVYLPALDVALDEERPAILSALPQGDGEMILVVEDNVSLRMAMVSTLGLLNYRTLEAADGREALSVLELRAADVSLVLSDLVMPEMGGQSLFYALRERDLALPMVMMTGHPMEHELLELQAQGLAGWMLKPPAVDELATMLARVLHGKNQSVV